MRARVGTFPLRERAVPSLPPDSRRSHTYYAHSKHDSRSVCEREYHVNLLQIPEPDQDPEGDNDGVPTRHRSNRPARAPRVRVPCPFVLVHVFDFFDSRCGAQIIIVFFVRLIQKGWHDFPGERPSMDVTLDELSTLYDSHFRTAQQSSSYAGGEEDKSSDAAKNSSSENGSSSSSSSASQGGAAGNDGAGGVAATPVNSYAEMAANLEAQRIRVLVYPRVSPLDPCRLFLSPPPLPQELEKALADKDGAAMVTPHLNATDFVLATRHAHIHAQVRALKLVVLAAARRRNN